MKLLPAARRGNIVEKGIMLVLFFFLIVFLPMIFMMINSEMATTMNESYGEGSPAQVVSSYGINSTVRFSKQVPMAATVGGITIVILLVGFAIGDYLTKRNEQNNQPPSFTGGGFGG